MSYFSTRNLTNAIFSQSVEKIDIKLACNEWEETKSFAVFDGNCVCGQGGLETVYVFVNKHNGNELHVGSTCREHFYALDLVKN